MKISKSIIKDFAKWLDELIKAKGVAELVDGIALSLALNFANDKWGDLIPDEITPKIESILQSVMDGNYTAAENTLAELLTDAINTPLIDGTESELEAYKTFIETIDKLIRGLLQKKNDEQN